MDRQALTGRPAAGTAAEPTTLWNRSYIFVLVITTLNAFSFYMISTILSKYLVGIGASISIAGFIVGLFSLTSLFCRPVCGFMSDRINNVRLLKWSNILLCVGLLGFAVTKNIPLIIFFRIVNGLGFAVGGTTQVSLATRFIPANRIGEGIGYIGLSMVAGSAIAPGIGLAIADTLGMRVTFLAAASLTVVAYVLLMMIPGIAGTPTQKTDGKIHFSDILEPRAFPFTFVVCMFSFINGVIASYLVMYADERAVGGISIYFTVYAVCLFVIRPLSGKLMDRKGLRVTVFPGIVLTALSMFLLGRSASLLMILVTCVLRALGQGAAQPSLQAGCIKYVGRDKSGVATSTYYLGGDIGQGVGPMVGGVLMAQITGLAGYQLLFDLCGVLLLGTMIYFYLFCRKRNV